MTDALREAFEVYFADSRRGKGPSKRPTFARLADGTYADDSTQRHWWTWQHAAIAAPPGWQPIETAPEREWVLLAIEGRWVTTGDKWPGFGWAWEETDDEPEDARPTHWHPIPAAPSAPQSHHQR